MVVFRGTKYHIISKIIVIWQLNAQLLDIMNIFMLWQIQHHLLRVLLCMIVHVYVYVCMCEETKNKRSLPFMPGIDRIDLVLPVKLRSGPLSVKS